MCCDVLRWAPTLTHLTLEDIVVDLYDMPSSIVRHHSLTSLQIDGSFHDEGPDALLSYLDLPALEVLGIFANNSSKLYAVSGFLQRSSCNLKRFRLNINYSWMEHKQELMTLLDKMPSLEILDLECQYHESDASPIPSQLPTRIAIPEMKSINERLFLPNLEKVYIKLKLDSESYSINLLLRPDGSNIASIRRFEHGHLVPLNTLRLKPLHIYYLLDMETQRIIHLIIKNNLKIKSFKKDMDHFVDFIQQSIYCHVYDSDIRSSS